MAQEQSILKAKDEFDQMIIAIGKTAAEGQRIDLMERDLWQRMLAIVAFDALGIRGSARPWRSWNDT